MSLKILDDTHDFLADSLTWWYSFTWHDGTSFGFVPILRDGLMFLPKGYLMPLIFPDILVHYRPKSIDSHFAPALV